MLPNLPFEEYDRVVCIPTYEEFNYITEVLEDLIELPPKVLLLLNNNCRIDSPDDVKDNNQSLHEWLLTFPHHQDGDSYLIQWKTLSVVLLDHSHVHNQYPKHEGVGLARDELGWLACRLIEEKIVTCPWIWCTDGDVRLPENYLDVPKLKTGVELMGYIHKPAPLELILYEIGLRYYTLGLRWADSPIAFPTIGSCITIHNKTFQSIYGFPKRQAAEDFYLLNKAVKVGPILYSDTKTLTIRGRPSDRVPFGTGQGMKIIADQDLRCEIYHPEIFRILKQWIAILRSAPDDMLLEELKAVVPDYPYFKKIQKVIQQPCPEQQRVRRRFVFFDCFQTMRFIHHLRDTTLPSIPIEEALKSAPFIALSTRPSTPSLENGELWRKLQHEIYDQEYCVRGHHYQL